MPYTPMYLLSKGRADMYRAMATRTVAVALTSPAAQRVKYERIAATWREIADIIDPVCNSMD